MDDLEIVLKPAGNLTDDQLEVLAKITSLAIGDFPSNNVEKGHMVWLAFTLGRKYEQLGR